MSPEMIVRGGGRNSGLQRFLGHGEQPLRFRADHADADGRRTIGVIALILHADVDRQDIALAQDALGRRNPVHDLLVDGKAYAAREAVESLERRHGPIVASNEIGRPAGRADPS